MESRSNIERVSDPNETRSGRKFLFLAAAVGAATLGVVSGEIGTVLNLTGDVLSKLGEGASAING